MIRNSMLLLTGIILSLPIGATAWSQVVDDGGLWLATFTQGDLISATDGRRGVKWWFDGHGRFLDDTDGFHQSIVRPGLGIPVNENTNAWAGYAWISTVPVGGERFDEHRIWQQLTWSANHNNLEFALRPRFEQRLVNTGSDTGLRFRQLLRAQHNLPNLPHFNFVCWDELFFNLNDTDWGARSGFDQNRFFVGLGLKFPASSRFRTEIGYLNQTINSATGDDRTNHILSINLYR